MRVYLRSRVRMFSLALLCVVLGAGKVLDNVHEYDRVLMHSSRD